MAVPATPGSCPLHGGMSTIAVYGGEYSSGTKRCNGMPFNATQSEAWLRTGIWRFDPLALELSTSAADLNGPTPTSLLHHVLF